MTEDLTQLSPPEIDEMWIEAITPAAAKMGRANDKARSARRYLKAGGHYKPTGDRLLTEATHEEMVATAEYKLASAPFDAEFDRRGGWTRYLQVVASNGHVHSGSCHTITPGLTMVAPVFELSGQDGAGVVASAGHRACSKCFPDAPVETIEDRRAANVARGRCAGTGQRSTAIRPSGRYGSCGECGETVGVSAHGILRPHKAKSE